MWLVCAFVLLLASSNGSLSAGEFVMWSGIAYLWCDVFADPKKNREPI